MNNTLKCKIYTLAFGASGIGKIDGKVCFVEGALPGEEVLFKITKETPKYIHGEVLEILEVSPDRVKPRCLYYGHCGGCHLQHISYDKELYYKKQQIDQLIERIGSLKGFECEDIVPSSGCYNYRSTVTLHAKNEEYGYYARDNHSIINIRECPVADQAINEELKNLCRDNKKEKKDITLKTDYCRKVWNSTCIGERFFVDKYREINLYFSPKAFSQANRYISEKIAEKLEDWLNPLNDEMVFFDLYCGNGFFSYLLNKKVHLKVGIDVDRIAIDCAKTTAKEYGTDNNIQFYREDVEKVFLNIFNRFKRQENIIFMNPPREGVSKAFLEQLKNFDEIPKIYYLSCNPAALARDIKILTEGNDFRLQRAIPFDMFPRTKHIETLVEFNRIV